MRHSVKSVEFRNGAPKVRFWLGADVDTVTGKSPLMAGKRTLVKRLTTPDDIHYLFLTGPEKYDLIPYCLLY